MRFNPPLNMATMSTNELATLVESSREVAVVEAVRAHIRARTHYIVFATREPQTLEEEAAIWLDNLTFQQVHRLGAVAEKLAIHRPHPW